MNISLSFHILGIVFWLGTLILLPSLLKSVSNFENISGFVKKSWYGFLLPGALITTLSGLHQIGMKGVSYYMSGGWFHAKITLIVFLFILTFLLSVEVKKALSSEQPELSRGKLTIIHAGASASLLLICLLVFRVLM